MLLNNGDIVTGIRHFSPDMRDVMRKIYGPGEYYRLVKEQGFVDQHGTFMSRNEAYDVALAAGQISNELPRGPLFSEELY